MMKKLLIICGLMILIIALLVLYLHLYADYRSEKMVWEFYIAYKDRSSKLKEFKYIDIGPTRDIYAIREGHGSYQTDIVSLFDVDKNGKIKWIDVPRDRKAKFEYYIKKFVDMPIQAITGSIDTTGIELRITQGHWLLYLVDSTHIGEFWKRQLSDPAYKMVKVDGQWYYFKSK